jgi:hypothetical protein
LSSSSVPGRRAATASQPPPRLAQHRGVDRLAQPLAGAGQPQVAAVDAGDGGR